MWSAPLQAIIIGYILWTESGLAGIIGILVVFTVVPIQSYTGKLSSIFRLQTAIKTDERVRLMDEIISGVQVIKMYAWEKPFCIMIALARKLELKVVRKSSWIRGIFMTFNLFTTRAAIYCTLISMILFSERLTAEKTFVFASYFNILAHTMSAMFVRGVAEISECRVAVRRLQYFLMYDETIPQDPKQLDHAFIDDESPRDDEIVKPLYQNGLASLANDLANIVASQKSPINPEQWTLKLNNVTARWEPHNTDNTLHNLNLIVPKGKLYAVIGSVGSGKSSLISTILGELILPEGKVDINGKLSYAAQEAWVFGSTVRQNIIFGDVFDRQRYQKVVRACALLSDFKQFPQGDMTIVGERGSSLSGGQKARINLARAVYRQADIYILDDPLSAVDTHVGKHLFEECLQRYLSDKTRILATHQLQYIKYVDGIVLMEHGSMKFFKTYVDLLASCPEYSTLLVSDSANDTGDDSLSQEKPMRRQLSNASTKSRTMEASGSITDLEDDLEDDETVENLEGTSRGIIKGSLFFNYFKSGANWFFIITVGFLFLATQALASYNDFFMKILTNEEEQRYKNFHDVLSLNNSDFPTLNSTKSVHNYTIAPALTDIYIYTGIVISIFVVGISRSLLFYVLCVRSSQRLHDRSFEGLIRTGMRFFDTNPSGRILNRFSKDMGAIDELLPKAMLDAGQIILMMVGSLVVVCAINPIFLAPLAVIAFIFYWIRKVYLQTSKNVKRLEGMLRSPVFTHLNATLNGLTTIRAYGAQNVLKAEFDKFQDTHSSSWYMFIVTSTAFGFSLDVFCFVFTTIVTFSLLLGHMGFSGSDVGLAITTTMSMTGMIQWGMRQSAEVTNQMMSVERVLEYALLPPEGHIQNQTGSMTKKTNEKMNEIKELPVHSPSNWPVEGCIRFHHVYMRYAEDEQPVLKCLDLIIKPREKVGIVGRTGAGKSSLISALFRLAKVDGVVEIDGVDTGTIFLADLRRNISIIPQDPVLFSGTLRKNLDPFGEFKDEALWSVLEEVELKDSMVGSGGLDSKVYDRGTNFSAGQRQLVCLARAILRNNKILMLDEATANVDPHTDGLIQRTIRTKFAMCTVLTVAHRLNTIMDSDKVLVMDKGRMAEFDHPHLLLKNDYGLFTGLVKETGRAMSEQLMKIAKHAYDVTHGSSIQ